MLAHTATLPATCLPPFQPPSQPPACHHPSHHPSHPPSHPASHLPATLPATLPPQPTAISSTAAPCMRRLGLVSPTFTGGLRCSSSTACGGRGGAEVSMIYQAGMGRCTACRGGILGDVAACLCSVRLPTNCLQQQIKRPAPLALASLRSTPTILASVSRRPTAAFHLRGAAAKGPVVNLGCPCGCPCGHHEVESAEQPCMPNSASCPHALMLTHCVLTALLAPLYQDQLPLSQHRSQLPPTCCAAWPRPAPCPAGWPGP